MTNIASQQKTAPYTVYELALALGIVALAFTARYYGIERQSLWADELFGISTAYLPHFADIFPRLLTDSHPPGYLSFLYFYVPLFGESELQIRSHSLLAGTALVFLTYIFGRRYFSAATGLIAALLVAVNYESIYYSQEARAYAMLSVSCLLSLYYFTGFVLDGTCKTREKALFIFFSTAAMYLHYSGVVFVGCEGIVYFFALCARRWNLKFLTEGLLIFSLTGLLYAPWLSTMYHHITGFSDYWGAAQIVDSKTLVQLSDFLLGPYWGYSKWLYLGGWIICFIASLQIFLPKKLQLSSSKQSSALLITASMAALPIAVFYIKSQISMPVFQERHFVTLTPLIMLMAARPLAYFIEKLSSNILRYTILALVLSILGWKQIESDITTGLYRLYTKDAIREAFDIVLADKDFMRKDSHAVTTTHWQMNYYLRKSNFPQEFSSVYYDSHYANLRDALIKQGEFYFISIGLAESNTFLTASMTDFTMSCRRNLQTRTGEVDVVKMSLKTELPPEATKECAPELKLDFPLI